MGKRFCTSVVLRPVWRPKSKQDSLKRIETGNASPVDLLRVPILMFNFRLTQRYPQIETTCDRTGARAGPFPERTCNFQEMVFMGEMHDGATQTCLLRFDLAGYSQIRTVCLVRDRSSQLRSSYKSPNVLNRLLPPAVCRLSTPRPAIGGRISQSHL